MTNPAKAAAQSGKHSKKKLPPHQIEQKNPSYFVASYIVRNTVDRLSHPIANLLNGLLDGDARVVSESCIGTKKQQPQKGPVPQDQSVTANVWSIIYEFHKIAPSILTTVVGNLVNYLTSPELEQRQLVVQLLGRLFASGKLALQFRSCFREWLKRANDVEPEIRLLMVEYLIQLVPLPQREISQEAQQYLLKPLEHDSSLEVRSKIIHELCNTAFQNRNVVIPELWHLVGTRVSAKNKQERRDALTGLAQTYFKQYSKHNLKQVQLGGDDCDLEVVQEALAQFTEDDAYSWIPVKVFESAYFTDAMDSEMRGRVLHIMDDLLLGSDRDKQLTATAKAVGLAGLIFSLEQQKEESNAHSFLCSLLQERAKLQKAVETYISARGRIRDYEPGSVDALTAHAEAMDLLETVAALTALPTSNAGERNPILEAFHRQKDKHIFRILSTIVKPGHSSKARIRAMEEVPKRVKGDADLRAWAKTLVRRCAMGNFVNQESIHHCILLAQECFQEEDIGACQKFLECAHIATDAFPQLCANAEDFGTLMELFVECRGISSSKTKKLMGQFGTVTTLSTILSKVAPYTESGKVDFDQSANKHLLNLCCNDGTPEQARHAVNTLAALFNPNSNENLTQEQNDSFYDLLESLTSPSRLSVSIKGKSQRLVTILIALSQLTQFAPKIFDSKRGQKAIRFSLERVLLGRTNASAGDDSESDEEVDEDVATPPSSKRRRTNSNQSLKHRSPDEKSNLFEDASLSTTCRTLCAAIEFLSSYIRSSIFSSKASHYVSTQQMESSQTNLSPDLIEKVFHVLSQMISDHGVPPSDHDRKECKAPQDRAALRQSAAISLLRLCDPRLGLDRKFLTTERWHTLASIFLDDDQGVRDAVMTELSLMLTGHGKFGKCGKQGPMVPLLRLVAFVVLCVDGEHGGAHSIANGNAANVGKKASNIKAHAKECVMALRKVYEVTAAQARANGENAEKRFEGTLKVALMPEYIVPYAMHLIAFREETPYVGGKSGLSQASQNDHGEVDEAGHRVLKKRLKHLFDPLVLSLGDSADNISFLLRMTERLSKYEPVREPKKSLSQITVVGSSESREVSDVAQREGAKLRVVCAAARQVLLSYVKKDVNLAVYPGAISLRPDLFKKRKALQTKVRNISTESQPLASQVSRESGSYDKSSEVYRSPAPEKASGVHFSPELTIRNAQDPSAARFGDLSPIKKASPAAKKRSDVLLSSGEKTRGTTPPSVVRNTRFSASTSVAMDVTVDSEGLSPVSKMSEITTRSTRTRRSSSSAETRESSGTQSSSKKRRPSKTASTAKRQKTQPPAQIKVTRHKPKATSTRKSRRNSKTVDDFDFEENSANHSISKKAQKGKENNSKSKVAPRRGAKRVLRNR